MSEEKKYTLITTRSGDTFLTELSYDDFENMLIDMPRISRSAYIKGRKISFTSYDFVTKQSYRTIIIFKSLESFYEVTETMLKTMLRSKKTKTLI